MAGLNKKGRLAKIERKVFIAVLVLLSLIAFLFLVSFYLLKHASNGRILSDKSISHISN